MEENTQKRKGMRFWILLIVVAVAAFAVIAFKMSMQKEEMHAEPEIITVSTLEEIIKISDLSTYTAVYNGIATVYNAEETEEIDCYISYNATVKAGMDLNEVAISVDNENKIISVTLPEITIREVAVDESSMEYIYLNKKANVGTEFGNMLKACKEDVTKECNAQQEIFDLAKQNAVNMVQALLKPIVEQLDQAYELTIIG